MLRIATSAISTAGRARANCATVSSSRLAAATTAGHCNVNDEENSSANSGRGCNAYFRSMSSLGQTYASRLSASSQGGVTATKRFNSTSSSGNSDGGQGEEPKFDEYMDKLFHEAQTEAKTADDEWFVDPVTDASAAWEPTWYNLPDQAVNVVQTLHEVTGFHYAGSIFATTCVVRLIVLPVAIKSQKAASRMAHLQPELQVLKQRYEALGTPTQAEQKAFAQQMKSLFKKYEVGPFQALVAPLVQIPLFISMFFGMKKMPEIFPTEMSTGGMAWFVDLTIPDPTYVLPLVCGVSFLATIEAGKEQMIDSNPAMGATMVNAFRGMAFIMVPVMTTFPAAMLCYWVPNNVLTFAQSVMLRNPWVKKQLGIWDRPKAPPGAKPDVGMQETMNKLLKQVKGEPTTEKEKMQKHNEEVETRKKMNQLSKATRSSRRRSVATSAVSRKRR